MNDVELVKRELARRVEELAAISFPNGQREGAHWCVGSIDRRARQVFQNLHRWRKGWALGRLRGFGKAFPKPARSVDAGAKCDFKTALREAAQWLGVTLAPSPNNAQISHHR